MLAFLAFVAPNLLLLGAFVFWPIVYSLYLSFFKWNMIASVKTFLGFGNYRSLFLDPVFWQVTCNTLVLAVGLKSGIGGRSVYRAIIFPPTFTTSVAVAMVWLWIFEPSYGLLKVFLKPMGLDSPDWLKDVNYSLPAVIIVLIWSGIGYDMVLFLAGFKNIPREMHEAALVDGADSWQDFICITFPAPCTTCSVPPAWASESGPSTIKPP